MLHLFGSVLMLRCSSDDIRAATNGHLGNRLIQIYYSKIKEGFGDIKLILKKKLSEVLHQKKTIKVDLNQEETKVK